MKKEKTLIRLIFGIIPLFIVFSFLGGHGGCTSSGRDSGGTIWGTMRSADNPNEGITNAFVSLDDRSVFAITSGTGYFSVLGVPAGTYNVKITKYGNEIFKGSAMIDRSGAMVPNDGTQNRFGEASFMVEFPGVLPGESALACTLLDPDDNPVIGAEVDLIYKGKGYFYVADTDIAGSFYLDKIHPSPDMMIIEADGFRPTVFTTETIEIFMESGILGATVNLIPLEREEPVDPEAVGSVKGAIRDESGALLSDIKVALIPYNEDVKPIDSIAKIKTTGEGGTYEFTNIDAGEYIVWAGGPNYFPMEQRITLTSGGMLTINFTLDDATNREMHPLFKPPKMGMN